ncbi:hypothetical protein cyc_06770 [Cyclospora cayetanensis]|uniref:Uncharacterized protein n=1 Tax=Cyclospora cayetanensis TaxID=88456 RepID=A0A1D3CUG2_9EIME|nr:hypothetical protein cyc_06770 [Cyclospora cayetanensis]
MRPYRQFKREPVRRRNVKREEGMPWQQAATNPRTPGGKPSTSDTSRFMWGEFIPCDICVDVMAMLHLHRRFGDCLKHLQSHLMARGTQLLPDKPAQRDGRQRKYTAAEMGELKRCLAASGVSIQGVADVASQYFSIDRKLASLEFANGLSGASRAMPASVGAAGGDLQGEACMWTSNAQLAGGVESLVWRLQLVLAAAYMPFGFSHIRDSSMQAPFNMSQERRSHFAYNVLCYEAFRERPDLLPSSGALQEDSAAASRAALSSSPSPARGMQNDCVSPAAERQSSASSSSFSRTRRAARVSSGESATGEQDAKQHTPACRCAAVLCEGGTDIPSLRRGDLEAEVDVSLATNAELNRERWSQLHFVHKAQQLLRCSCSVAFRVNLAAALLQETDPQTLFGMPPHGWEGSRFVLQNAKLLLCNAFKTWMQRQQQAHAALGAAFDALCVELSAGGMLEASQGGAWRKGLSLPAAQIPRFFDGCAEAADALAGESASSHDEEGSSSSEATACVSKWLEVVRELDALVARSLHNAAATSKTRQVMKSLFALLLRRPNEVQQLLLQQRGVWSAARSQTDVMDRVRAELAAVLTHPSTAQQLASALGPLHFFSLRVDFGVPLADVLLCEGWIFDFSRGRHSGEQTGPLQRVQELLLPLLSAGCRALLPLDIRGAAEAVKEFYSSKQVRACRQQARGTNTKRAKGEGRLRFLAQQRELQVPTFSVWRSLVEECIDALAASAETAQQLASAPAKADVASAAAPSGELRRLLEEAAKTTQVVSAYWRHCTLDHAQLNARKSQILVFGDSHRRALLQWLHRAANAVTLATSRKRQGEMRGPELECISQPLWASTLPFADKRSSTAEPLAGSHSSALLQGEAAASQKPPAPADRLLEELLLEAAQSTQAAAGGADMQEACLGTFASLALSASGRLLEMQHADFERAERLLEERDAAEEAPQRGRLLDPTADASDTGVFDRASRHPLAEPSSTLLSSRNAASSNRRRQISRGKGSSLDPHSQTQSVKDENRTQRPLAHCSRLPEQTHAPAGRELPPKKEVSASTLSGASKEVVQDRQGGGDHWIREERRYALHEGPFFSVSHRFLKAFLALDAEGRSKRRLTGRPSTARVCRIAEQSILHSNGPFYPESQSREFLLLSLSEWDTSAGLGSGGSDVVAASLLPPLPHLEELLLFLLASAVSLFVSESCLCYCCKVCPCNPQGRHGALSGASEAETGGKARCFREFAFVPQFLWKEPDIALLNEARAALDSVLRPVADIRVDWGGERCDFDDGAAARTLATKAQGSGNSDKFAGTWIEDEEEEDEATRHVACMHTLEEPQRGHCGSQEQAAAAAGASLDSLLEQLVRPKTRLQYTQRLGATTATAHLRSRVGAEHEAGAAELPKAENRIPASAADTRGFAAPCWEKLDRAKQQREEREGESQLSASSIAVWSTQGAAVSISPSLKASTAAVSAAVSAAASQLSAPPLSERTAEAACQTSPDSTVGCSLEAPGRLWGWDPLAKALAESLEFAKGPHASKTILLPESAKPSMWGLPVSLLMLQHSEQKLPPLAGGKAATPPPWHALSPTDRTACVERLLLQCANSCCRVPLGVVAELQRVSIEQLPSAVPSWAILALKYLLEELSPSAERQPDADGDGPFSGETPHGGRGTARELLLPLSRRTHLKGVSVQETLLQWLQETRLLTPTLVEELRSTPKTAEQPELWVLDTERAERRRRSSCSRCYCEGLLVRDDAERCACKNWSCVIGCRFPHRLVPLLDDEKASLAKLKLESRLLLTPPSLAFVCTYLQPLLRTRRRLQVLLRAKQEETFKPGDDPAVVAQQNRMKQQQSHAVDQLVGWVLCGGPVSHVVGFRIFQYHVFPSDSLVDVGGHTDAQRVFFWRRVASALVPQRIPLERLQQEQQQQQQQLAEPLLPFGAALALGRRLRHQGGSRQAAATTPPTDSVAPFAAAAEIIYKFEQSVALSSHLDMQKSADFVAYLTTMIARRCSWRAEKAHLHDSEMYQKFMYEFWDADKPLTVPGGEVGAEWGEPLHDENEHLRRFAECQRGRPQGPPVRVSQQHQQGPLSSAIRTMLAQTSSHLQESIMPSDLFDWQQRLLEKQRRGVLRHLDSALAALPEDWVQGKWTTERVMQEHPSQTTSFNCFKGA